MFFSSQTNRNSWILTLKNRHFGLQNSSKTAWRKVPRRDQKKPEAWTKYLKIRHFCGICCVLEVGPLARGVFAARWNLTWKTLSVACFVYCFLLFLMMFLRFWCVASGGAGVDLQTLLERGLGLQHCCQRTKDQRLAKGSEDRNLPFFCLIP